MAMGKAVITSKISSCSDFVEKGVNGFYVAPGDSQALRERILHLLDNPEVAEEMGKNGRLAVEERFSLDLYAGNIARATGLLARGNSSSGS